jgi:hypothetical protein
VVQFAVAALYERRNSLNQKPTVRQAVLALNRRHKKSQTAPLRRVKAHPGSSPWGGKKRMNRFENGPSLPSMGEIAAPEAAAGDLDEKTAGATQAAGGVVYNHGCPRTQG